MIPYIMLYAVVAGIPILVLAALEAAFLRTHGRAERGVWIVALLLAIALPLAVLDRPRVALPPVDTAVIATVPSELSPVLVLPPASERASDIDASAFLLAMWAAISAGIALRWSISWFRLLRVRRGWRTQTMDGVPVIVTSDVGPGLFGLLRPRIVIPSWVATLSSDQRAFVLRHEQEHLRGHDHWLGALARLSRTLVPWNPIVWLLAARLGRAMELDCDRRVLRAHPDVAGYGETLLLVTERRSPGLVPSAAFTASEATLRKRIVAMTTPPRTLSALSMVAAVMAGLVLLGLTRSVPVPALGASVTRLSRVMAAPPAQLPPVIATVMPADSPTAAPGLPPELEQAAPLALPPVRIITDPRRGRQSMYLFSPDGSPRLVHLGYGIVTANGRVLVNPAETPAAVPYLLDDRLEFITIDDLNPVVITAPFPGGPPREITEAPRIVNPAEVLGAIADAYPPDLRARGVGGTVGVHFLVGEAGEVRETRVGQISAFDELNRAALGVAAVYRFSPARAGEEYVALWVSHAVGFWVP